MAIVSMAAADVRTVVRHKYVIWPYKNLDAIPEEPPARHDYLVWWGEFDFKKNFAVRFAQSEGSAN